MRRPPTGAETPDDPIRFGAFELDAARFELRRDGERVAVEPRTLDLLRLLAINIGQTVTRDEIFDSVWQGRIVSDAALSSQIRAARQVLGDDGTAQRIIATVHRRGFRLRRQAGMDGAAQGPDTMANPAPGCATAAATRTILPTLLVLPCTNLDGDGRAAIIAQGLSEDLITALSRNRWMRVVSASTARALGQDERAVAELGRAVAADYLVTGSVRRSGDRIRVTAQAADASSMRSIWSESFTRDMTDIFALQDEISDLIAARLATELGIKEQQKAARMPRRNLGAWEIFQLGTAAFYRFTPQSNQRCQTLMRQAIRHDPDLAGAYARLAYAIVLEMVYFDGPRDADRLDEALRIAEAGAMCDDQDANTLFALGRVRLARCEYDLAIAALQEALRLNPGLAVAHCGLGDSLAYEGRVDAALHSFQTAIDLSPHDPFRWAFMSYRSLAHLFAGDHAAAAHWAGRAVQVPNAHYWARANLVAARGHLGEDCTDAAAALLRAQPRFSRRFARERMFYVRSDAQIDLLIDGLRRAGIS